MNSTWKVVPFVGCLLVGYMLSPAVAAPLHALDFDADHVPDELIVALPEPRAAGVVESCFDPRRITYLNQQGARVIREYKLLRACRIRFRVSTGSSLLALRAAEIGARPDLFGRITLDHVARLEQGSVTNDPLYPEQWGLEDIDAEAAWTTTTGDARTLVAVVDSGIDYRHPDLVDNVWKNPCEVNAPGDGDTACSGQAGNGYPDDVYGFNFVDDLPDPLDKSALAHGTMLAGVIGAVTNNGKGIAGTSWHVKLLALKFARGGTGSVADAAEAIRYAVREKVHVINASFSTESDDPLLREAIEAANGAGILVVAAAATDDGTAKDLDDWGGYPCVYDLPNVLCVTAVDKEGVLASSWGATTVDLAAPGVDIRSTFTSPDYRLQSSGSSMAAAFVSGVAALIRSACPSVSVAGLRGGLLSGKPFSYPADKRILTGQRLDAGLALVASCAPAGPGPPALLEP